MSNEARRKRVLFVDDDPAFLATVRELFSEISRGAWEVATAQNHAQALEQLGREPIDLIVLDIQMPVMNGLEFLRLLRRTHPAQQVVILTGHADEPTRKNCLAEGAALFFEKCIDPAGFDVIFAALQALLSAAPQTGFRGMMRSVGLQDVIQMECLGRKSSILEVFTPRTRGQIYIHDGSLVHAESGALQGEVALYGLLALRGGEFNLLPYHEPARRSISGHYEFQLMEAARLSDESIASNESGGAGEAARAATVSDFSWTPAPSDPPSLSASDTAVLQAAAVRATRLRTARIEEVVLCSGAGEVLYETDGALLEKRVELLVQVELQAVQLSGLLPFGRFDRLELISEQDRIVCQIQPHMRLFVRSSRSPQVST